MGEHSTQREQLRELADRLVVEYAGLLPPGQVLAAVFRTNHSLGMNAGVSGEPRLRLCESLVRQVLARRAEVAPPVLRAVPSWTPAKPLAS